jgi:hypothetical protein
MQRNEPDPCFETLADYPIQKKQVKLSPPATHPVKAIDTIASRMGFHHDYRPFWFHGNC